MRDWPASPVTVIERMARKEDQGRDLADEKERGSGTNFSVSFMRQNMERKKREKEKCPL